MTFAEPSHAEHAAECKRTEFTDHNDERTS